VLILVRPRLPTVTTKAQQRAQARAIVKAHHDAVLALLKRWYAAHNHYLLVVEQRDRAVDRAEASVALAMTRIGVHPAHWARIERDIAAKRYLATSYGGRRQVMLVKSKGHRVDERRARLADVTTEHQAKVDAAWNARALVTAELLTTVPPGETAALTDHTRRQLTTFTALRRTGPTSTHGASHTDDAEPPEPTPPPG
jgi:hypothetical protein